MGTTIRVKKVLVCGDVAVDWFDVFRHPRLPAVRYDIKRHCENWRLYSGAKRVALGGGAYLMRDAVAAMFGGSVTVLGPQFASPEGHGPNDCIQSFMRVDRFEIPQKDKPKLKLWRVRDYLGYDGPDTASSLLERVHKDALDACNEPLAGLVIDDAANGFRNIDPAGRLKGRLTAESLVLWELSRPVPPRKGCCAPRTVAGCGARSRKLTRGCHFPLIILLDADDLRSEGVTISHGSPGNARAGTCLAPSAAWNGRGSRRRLRRQHGSSSGLDSRGSDPAAAEQHGTESPACC